MGFFTTSKTKRKRTMAIQSSIPEVPEVPEILRVRKPRIRIVFKAGAAVGLVRARTDSAAVLHHIKVHDYEAHVASQDELLLYSKQFEVDDADAIDEPAAE
jgi:hypothetical protein